MRVPAILPLVLVGGALFLVGRCSVRPAETGGDDAEAAAADVPWTCPMHPQIQVPDPVPCPICGMDLVEFDPSSDRVDVGRRAHRADVRRLRGRRDPRG